MRTILNLIVLTVVAVAVIEYVLPAIQGRADRRAHPATAAPASEPGAWDCVAAASTASENFSAATRAAAQRAGNDRGYPTVVADARAEIEDARARCLCAHVACGTAGQALDALEELVGTYDDMLSGTGLANPARARERVEELLAEARRAAAEDG